MGFFLTLDLKLELGTSVSTLGGCAVCNLSGGRRTEKSDFFTGVYPWPLLRFLPIKLAVLEYNTLYKDTVFFREGWDFSPDITPLCKSSITNFKFIPRRLVHQRSPLLILFVGRQPFPSAVAPHRRPPLPYII